jgi:Flp pilus assembly protein TadD
LHLLICAVICAASAVGCQKATEAKVAPTQSLQPVSFDHDVAPIVFQKCAGCHHPGESAPFSLLSYEDAQRRGRQIVELTQKRFMPPWLPSAGADHFVGARKLTDNELETLKSWVDQGCPRGDDTQLPPQPTFTDGWQLGPPDLVLESPAYTLAAEGADVFRNFVVPIQLDGPRWVESIELRPENPRATHHARLGVDSFNESIRRDAEDPEPGYAGMAWAQDPDGQLVIWAPGMVAHPGKPGIAWRLLPKTCLVLHTHMQTTGKPETVKFRIGFHFAKDAPRENPVMMRIGSCEIDIPAGAAHHVVTDEYRLPIDVLVHDIFPHAHSLCTALNVVAEQSDGTRNELINIDHFDENWHDLYRFVEPILLPRGTKLRTTFTYDNTDANAKNRHHPPRRTVYGSNVDDEMSDVYLQVTAAQPDERAVLMEHYKRYELQTQVAGFRKALAEYPDNTWDEEALATNYIGLSKPRDAIRVLEQRLKTGPRAVYPIVSLGMAYIAAGDFERAESLLREAIAIDKEYALAWYGLGKSLAMQKKFTDAEQAFHQALVVAPGLPEVRVSLAELLLRRGDLDEAATECTAAIADAPDSAEFYLRLAEIRAKQKRDDEALECCREAQRLAPYTHPPKVLLAVYHVQNGDFAGAKTLLEEAGKESPTHPAPSLFLGQLARREKHPEDARRYFAEALAKPIPTNWPNSHKQRFLVLLYSEQLQLAEEIQDLDLARSSLANWMGVDPENPQLRQMSEHLRGVTNATSN